MAPRVAVGGIEHETSSFLAEPTLLEDFARRTVRGEALARLGDANTIVDGFVRGVRDSGLELVPLSWAKATSGGPPVVQRWRNRPDDGKLHQYYVGLAVTQSTAKLAKDKKPFKAAIFTGLPFANGIFNQNQELALSTFRWLTDKTHLVTVPTKRYVSRTLELSYEQVIDIRWLLIGWLPGGIALAGLAVFLIRRRT